MNRSIVVIIFVLACCVTTVGNCHAYLWAGHEYLLTTTPKTWVDAEAEAVTQGGHLVTINNATEQAMLQAWLPVGDTNNYWIGFTDQAVEGTWVWCSGEPVTYTNWNSGEPNNMGSENWAYLMSRGVTGLWNDVGVSYTQIGIIERPSAVPIPAAAWLLGSGLAGLIGARRRFTK
jgi:hypothetical protein